MILRTLLRAWRLEDVEVVEVARLSQRPRRSLASFQTPRHHRRERRETASENLQPVQEQDWATANARLNHMNCLDDPGFGIGKDDETFST
jgi:hypothetical protein